MTSRLLCALAASLALFTGAASAQNLADKCKPMRLMLAQGPGSASDFVARAYAKAITDVSGINVIVDYKPGAESVVGVQAFKTSPPDGCTILLVNIGNSNALFKPDRPLVNSTPPLDPGPAHSSTA